MAVRATLHAVVRVVCIGVQFEYEMPNYLVAQSGAPRRTRSQHNDWRAANLCSGYEDTKQPCVGKNERSRPTNSGFVAHNSRQLVTEIETVLTTSTWRLSYPLNPIATTVRRSAAPTSAKTFKRPLQSSIAILHRTPNAQKMISFLRTRDRRTFWGRAEKSCRFKRSSRAIGVSRFISEQMPTGPTLAARGEPFLCVLFGKLSN